MDNRLTQQLVAGHAGVEEGLPSLEVELVGAGDPVGGGPWVTAGLEGLSCSSRGETVRIDKTVGKCNPVQIMFLLSVGPVEDATTVHIAS